MTSIVPTNPSKVRRFGVAFVLYVGSARHWIECQKAPEDAGGDPLEVDAQVVDRLAPGTGHWVHEEPSTDEFFHYRFRHVLENETPSIWTAWQRAKAEEIPDVLPLHLAGAKPRFDLDLILDEATGVVTAIVDAEPEVKSVKLALSTTDFPDGGTGTAFDTDAEGDLTQDLAPALNDGEIGYVTASFYDAVSGGGSLLGTLRATAGVETGPPLTAPPNFEAHFEGRKVVMTWDPVAERSIAGYLIEDDSSAGDPDIGVTDSTRFEFDAGHGIGAVPAKRSYQPIIRAFRGSAMSPQLGPSATDFVNDAMPNPDALGVAITSGQGFVRFELTNIRNSFATEFFVHWSETAVFTPDATNMLERHPILSHLFSNPFAADDPDKVIIAVAAPVDANGEEQWSAGQTIYFEIGAKDPLTDALDEQVVFRAAEIAHTYQTNDFHTGPPSELGFTGLTGSMLPKPNGGYQVQLGWSYAQGSTRAAAFRLFVTSDRTLPPDPTQADVLTTLAVDSGDTGPWTFQRDGFASRTHYKFGISAGRVNPDGSMSWSPITIPSAWSFYNFEIHIFEPHFGPSIPTTEGGQGGSGGSGGGDGGFFEQPIPTGGSYTDDGAEELIDRMTGHAFALRYPGSDLYIRDLEPAEGGADVTGAHTSADTTAVAGTPAATVKGGAQRAIAGLDLTGALTGDLAGDNILASGTLWIPSFTGLKPGAGSVNGTAKPIKIPAANFQPFDPADDEWSIDPDGVLGPTAGGGADFYTVFRLPVGIRIVEMTMNCFVNVSLDLIQLRFHRLGSNGAARTELAFLDEGPNGVWTFETTGLNEVVGNSVYAMTLFMFMDAGLGGTAFHWAELEWKMEDYKHTL